MATTKAIGHTNCRLLRSLPHTKLVFISTALYMEDIFLSLVPLMLKLKNT